MVPLWFYLMLKDILPCIKNKVESQSFVHNYHLVKVLMQWLKELLKYTWLHELYGFLIGLKYSGLNTHFLCVAIDWRKFLTLKNYLNNSHRIIYEVTSPFGSSV